MKLPDRQKHWNDYAKAIRQDIMQNAWNPSLNSFVSIWGGNHADAFLLLLPELGFVAAKDEQFKSTLEVIERTLRKKDSIVFYPNDEIGLNSATFWYVML